MKKAIAGLCSASVLVACGGNSGAPANTRDLATYESSALQASTAVSTYQQASASVTTADECRAAVAQYASTIQPALERMRQMAGVMDETMRSMHHPESADMGCGAEVMHLQLQEHLATACASDDMTTNRTRAAEHCDDMLTLTEQERQRAGALSGMMGSGTMHQGDHMGGGTSDAGTGTGATAMPGCTYADGGYHAEGGTGAASPALAGGPADAW